MNLPTFSRRELRDAARLAIQSAVSASALFILMKTLGMPEKFVGILSAVLVINPGLGSTITSAWKRVAATVIGAGVGCLCLWLIPGGYGTALALGVSILVMNAISGLFPQWQYGVVAAVALALGSENDVLQTSLDRTLAIGLGVLVGTISSLVIWPEKSSTRTDRFIRDALAAISETLKTTLAGTDESISEEASRKIDSLNNRYGEMISSARSEAANVRIADNGNLLDRIKATDWLHQALETIRQIANNEDDIDKGNEEASGVLSDVRESIAKVLEDITDRKGEASDEDIQAIGDGVKKFRSIVSKDSDLDNWSHVNRATLVFALDQIYESLKTLSKHFTGSGGE